MKKININNAIIDEEEAIKALNLNGYEVKKKEVKHVSIVAFDKKEAKYFVNGLGEIFKMPTSIGQSKSIYLALGRCTRTKEDAELLRDSLAFQAKCKAAADKSMEGYEGMGTEDIHRNHDGKVFAYNIHGKLSTGNPKFAEGKAKEFIDANQDDIYLLFVN